MMGAPLCMTFVGSEVLWCITCEGSDLMLVANVCITSVGSEILWRGSYEGLDLMMGAPLGITSMGSETLQLASYEGLRLTMGALLLHNFCGLRNIVAVFILQGYTNILIQKALEEGKKH